MSYKRNGKYSENYIQALATFVPEHIKRFISDNAHDNYFTPPLIQEMHSVVLFADVGGFTLLGEQMAAKGNPGCEELGFYLNRYFEQLVKFTLRAGGDVVKFVGDALMVMWPSDYRISPKECVHRAIQCSLEIVEIMAHARLADDVKLSVKIGIGVGKSTVLHIGDTKRRLEYILVGPPLKQALLCENAAEVGNVIISKEAYDYVKDLLVDCSPMAGSNMYKVWKLRTFVKNMKLKTTNWRKLVDFSRRLSCYIPPSVLPHLHMNQKGWAAELRQVTVLFVNLDLNLGLKDNISDKIHILAQSVIKTILSAVYSYEGSLNKFLLDDKGATVVSCFGLPPIAHQQDPTRGVLASLQMHLHLAKIKIKCSIGVTSGLVYCGLLGCYQRRHKFLCSGSGVFREYTVLGDIVNLASRLMMQAKKHYTVHGGIFCCTQTRNLAHNEKTLHFEPLPAITVKGKSCPVKVFRPSWTPLINTLSKDMGYFNNSSTQQEKSPMCEYIIGRTDAQKRIKRVLNNEKGGVIFVMGEVGTGKTHLLRSVTSYKDLKTNVVWGRSKRFSRGEKYAVWKSTLKDLLVFHGFFTESQWRRSMLNSGIRKLFRNCVEKNRPELIPYLPVMNEMLDTKYAETFESQKLTVDEMMWKSFEIVFFLLEYSTKRNPDPESSVLILLDEVQDMGMEDWHLTARLCRAVKWGKLPRTTIILASRPLHMLKYSQNQRPRAEQEYINILSWREPKPPAVIIFSEGPVRKRDKKSREAKEQFTKELMVNFLNCKHKCTTIDPEFVKFVHEKTGGCSMFVLKFLQSLLLNGKISFSDTSRVSLNINLETPQYLHTDIPTPWCMQQNATAQIDNLSTSQIFLLKIASVIWRGTGDNPTYFERNMFAPFSTKEPFHSMSSIEDDLRLLEQGEYITTLDKGYVFKYGFFRDVCYQLMLYDQRRSLHETVLKHIERVYSDRYPENDCQLAPYSEMTEYTKIIWKRQKLHWTWLSKIRFRGHFEIHGCGPTMRPEVVEFSEKRRRMNLIKKDFKYFKGKKTSDSMMIPWNFNKIRQEQSQSNFSGRNETPLVWERKQNNVAVQTNFEEVGEKNESIMILPYLTRRKYNRSKSTGNWAYEKPASWTGRRNKIVIRTRRSPHENNPKFKNLFGLLKRPKKRRLQRELTERPVKKTSEPSQRAVAKEVWEGKLKSVVTKTGGEEEPAEKSSRKLLPRLPRFWNSKTKKCVRKTERALKIKIKKNVFIRQKESSKQRWKRSLDILKKLSHAPKINKIAEIMDPTLIKELSLEKSKKLIKKMRFNEETPPEHVKHDKTISHAVKWLIKNIKLESAPDLLEEQIQKLQIVFRERGWKKNMSAIEMRKLSSCDDYKLEWEVLRTYKLQQLLSRFDLWDFDIFELGILSYGQPLLYLGYKIFSYYNLLQRCQVKEKTLVNFLYRVEKAYNKYENPYHNSLHATDVSQSCLALLKLAQIGVCINVMDLMLIVISAICHDIGHPGVTNVFLGKELGENYTSAALLENFHCTAAIAVLSVPSLDIFKHTVKGKVGQYKMRQNMVNLILATDLGTHGQFMKQAGKMMLNKDFACFNEGPPYKKNNCPLSLSLMDATNEDEIFINLFIMKLILKCADICNASRKSQIYFKWAKNIQNEFYRQGELERKNGFTISMYMDQSKPHERHLCQIGFINKIVAPLYELLYKILPAMDPICMLHMRENYDKNLALSANCESEIKQPTRGKSPRPPRVQFPQNPVVLEKGPPKRRYVNEERQADRRQQVEKLEVRYTMVTAYNAARK